MSVSSTQPLPRLATRGEIAADLAACEELTHRRGANFSVGFRFLPRRKRQAVYAAYSFCRYADDLADEVGTDDRSAALDVWELELERAYEGRATHLVSRALSHVLGEFPIPQSAFADLIAGCRRDLVQSRYASFDELAQYCREVAISISEISLAIFGVRHELAHVHGSDLAMALQLTNITRDVGEDLERDRIYLPQDELAAFGVTEGELRRGLRGRGVRDLMVFQAERARRYFRRARPLVEAIEPDARVPTALMASVYAGVLDEIAARGFDVFPERVGLSTAQKVAVVARVLWRPRILVAPAPFRA